MDRANENSQAAQQKILVAIGDVSNYAGGYGDGTSLAGGHAHHSNGSSAGGTGSGSGSGTAAAASISGGGSSGTHVGGGASRLFKIGSSSTPSLRKAAKNSNTIGEFTDYLNDDDMAAIDHQLTTAADLYCKAAGVFEYIVQGMIPRWSESVAPSAAAAGVAVPEIAGSTGGLSIGKSSQSSGKKGLSESSRPVDMQTSVVSAHIKLAMAEAHACTVRKAAIKAARASAIKLSNSRGSPSATGISTSSSGSSAGSTTSYVLLAKLTIGVKEEYERAYGLLKSVKDLNEIATEFRAHVKDGKVYYEALAQTLLGVDAYESQQYGKAIGFMTVARASFASLSKSSKAHMIAQAAAFEYRLANEKVAAFQKINDSVTFEQVPTQAQLLGVMPSGRDLLQPKKYLVPRPSFGTAADAGDGGHGGTDDSVSKLSYALQGAYF
ncbi:BRO1-like domain-containing protein [Dissophora ornata]|nr:BRO1-like domain-containing protein [Dissophora ornata]